MMCVMPTITAAVLLSLAGYSWSDTVNSCLTVKSGLPGALTVAIDGALVPLGSSKDFTISRGSALLSVQLKKGRGNFVATANKLYAAVTKFVCTSRSAISDSTWINIGYDDSTWPYKITAPSNGNWNSAQLSIAQLVYAGLMNDLNCRVYLSCNAGSPTAPTTTRKTNWNGSGDSSDSSEERATTTTKATTPTTTIKATTAAPTTPTTVATTTAATVPVVQGTSGGGNYQGGQPATLQCVFSAVQLPYTVTWYLNNSPLDASNSNTAVQADGNLLATYTIPAVGAPTAGQYTCQMSNTAGSTTGPAINIAVTYSSAQVGANGLAQVYPLNGLFDQTVLLQASQGCQGLVVQFQATNSPLDSDFNDNVVFDAAQQQVITIFGSGPWPSECNNANVWVWVTLTSSGLSVGTGPQVGQNVVTSTGFLTGTQPLYLALGNQGTVPQAYYLYQPLP